MNKIFKVKKTLLGKAVVVSELAKNRGKVASALLFSLLTVSMAHAAPVAIQGVATSENAVAIGENSFTTAVDGVAGGQGAVATGNGFTREEFTQKQNELSEKIKEQRDLQTNIHNINNIIEGNDVLIDDLNSKIQLNRNLDVLATQKKESNNSIQSDINELTDNLKDKKNELDTKKIEFEQLYGSMNSKDFDLVPTLRSLDWTQLNNGSEGKVQLANDLKSKIEAIEPEVAQRFDTQEYINLVNGYQNWLSGMQSTQEKVEVYLIQKYGGEIAAEREDGFGIWRETIGYSGPITDPLLFQPILNDFSFLSINEADKYNGAIINANHKHWIDQNGVHQNARSPLHPENKTNYNTEILYAASVNKFLESNPNERGYLNGIGDYYKNGNLYNFKIKNKDGTFRHLVGSHSPSISYGVRVSDGFYQHHIVSLDYLLNNPITEGDVRGIKNFHNSVVEFYENVDWEDSNAFYDLNPYKEAHKKLVDYSAKILSYAVLNEEILNEKKKTAPDENLIQQKFIEAQNLLKELEVANIDSNFGKGLKPTYTQRAYDFYELGKEDAIKSLEYMRDNLTVFDRNHTIVKSLDEKYKEKLEEINNIQNQLDGINKTISDKKAQIQDLTPEEQDAIDELLKLELELKLAEQTKDKLENDLKTNTEKLKELNEELKNSNLTDLGLRSQAHGSNAFASGNDSIAMGTNATVTVKDGISIGRDVTVTGSQSIAIGADNKITGEKSIALGVGNTIKSNNVVAIGNDITVEAGFDKAVVLGAESTPETANPISSITIKGNQYNFAGTNPESTVSVGTEGKERQIVNVAAGRISTTSTDAINGSQLHAVAEAVERLETTTNINWDEINTRIQAVKVPKTSIIAGDNVNLSERTTDTGDIEYTVNVRLPDPQPTTPTTVQAPKKPATVVKVGDDSGNIKIVKEEGSVAEQKPDVYSVSINPELKLNKINVNGNTGKISGLTDGEVREGSTEAITGNQLHQTNLKVNHLTTNVNGLTDKVNQGLTFSTENNGELNKQLGERITIVGDGKNIETSVSDRGDIQVSLKDEIEVKKVKVGKTEITEKGINAGGNKIENVADGEVNPNSTDAVTGRQLYQAMTNIAVGSNQVAQNLGNQINKINNRVDNLEQRMAKEDKNLRAGVAGVAAIAGLPQVRGNGKSMVSAAAGNYRGQSAVAVGYTRASDNGKVLLKLSGSANTQGDVVSSVGIGYEW